MKGEKRVRKRTEEEAAIADEIRATMLQIKEAEMEKGDSRRLYDNLEKKLELFVQFRKNKSSLEQ